MRLDLRGIVAGYREHTVLRDVTLTVPSASVVALLGPNGAGKTTLLRVASGLLRPLSGQVLLDERDVTQDASYRLANLGVCHVPEGRGIFPNLTLRQNIVLQAVAGHEDDAIARACDAFPALGRRLSQQAGTLSGGEQQMLALAHAWVRQPGVVLLDEVSMGLAPYVIDEIFVFLQSLAEQGVALLVVEQYVARALELADYVYVLRHGEVAFAGEPAELAGTDVFETYVGSSA